jgi:hypothetical protein
MQTHYDDQHDIGFIDRLRRRAEVAKAASASTIAAGAKDEELGRWKSTNGMHAIHLSDDEQRILRISIGGGDHLPVTMNYVTYRGNTGECLKLLRMAIAALNECPE